VDITKREGLRMDKREMIEGALGWLEQIFRDPENQPPQWDSIAAALAESKDVIVIEAEVEHKDIDTIPWTGINLPTRDIVLLSSPYMNEMNLSGHHGTPGPYVLFGVPKQEDFEEFIMTETEAAIEGGIIDEGTGLPFDLEGEDG